MKCTKIKTAVEAAAALITTVVKSVVNV